VKNYVTPHLSAEALAQAGLMRSSFERASEVSFFYQRHFATPNLRMAPP